MPEPISTACAVAAASGLGDVLNTIVQGMMGNEAHLQTRHALGILAAKLRDGRVPENHELQLAATNALKCALNALALGIALDLDPKPPLVEAIRQQMKNGTLFGQPLIELRHCPEREWLLTLRKLINHGSSFGEDGTFEVIPEDQLVELFNPTVNLDIATRLHNATRGWLAHELRDQPGRPATLDDFLVHGWPLEKGDPQRITLYQAWCLFFHEQIKSNERVFRAFTADTLAACQRTMVELAKARSPDFSEYQGALRRYFAEPLRLLQSIDEKADQILASQGRLFEKLNELVPRSHHASLFQLPQVPEHFVGRKQMVDDIAADVRKAYAAADRYRLTRVIEGAGGLGKSAVAIAVGHALRDDFPDMQLFVRLRTHSGSPITAQQARNSLLQQIYPGWTLPQDEDALWIAYHSLFVDANGTPRRGLLILDDCRNDAQLRALMPNSPCPVIVTSRRAYASGVPEPVSKLDPESAVRLLVLIYPDLGVPNVGIELATLCGNFPIALRAAAGFLKRKKRKGSAILEYLTELRVNPLERLIDEDPEVNTRLVLEYSYRDLADSDSLALRALSVISADFDRAVACAIGDCRGDTIDLFVELHLIEVDPHTARYDWHDLLRALAAEKLNFDEQEAAGLRYVRSSLDIARRASEPFISGRGDFMGSYRLFDEERAHIEAAMNWLLARPHLLTEHCALANALHPRLIRTRLHWSFLTNWYNAVVSSAQEIDNRMVEANALRALGTVARLQGDHASARRHYGAARKIHCAIGDRSGEADALWGLGTVACLQGHCAAARAHYQAALKIHCAIGNRMGEAYALLGLGEAIRLQGDRGTARERYQAALEIQCAIGNRSGEAYALCALGDVARLQGDRATARKHYQAALDIYQAIGNREWINSLIHQLRTLE